MSRHGRQPRVRALLAGALVLGVGASLTLASWTDDTYAEGSFQASSFAVESNVTKPYTASGPWTDASAPPGPTLNFQATAMSPGVSFYAPIAIRTKPGSIGGTVQLTAPSLSGSTELGQALRYRVVRSSTCAGSAFTSTAAYVVGGPSTYSPLSAGQNTGVTNSLAPAVATSPGPPTQFCFEVRLPSGAPNSLQGDAASAVWHFQAVSGQ